MDTLVPAASGMNQKHLLCFIKRKMKYNDDIVMLLDGKAVTLQEVTTNDESYQLAIYHFIVWFHVISIPPLFKKILSL